MNKISVFGGTGFIGRAFCEKTSDCIVVDRNDVTPKSDQVLYFISTVDNYNVLTDSKLDINTNLMHLMSVLDECRKMNASFTFISSWFVYGDTDLPASESSVCRPKGFYSITKYAAEMLLESYCKTFNLQYKIIRLGNVVGAKDDKVSKKKNALQYLLNELKHNNPISLYDKGEFFRDYIHVDDVVDGISHIMEHGENGETYNLSYGKPVMFRDVIDYAYKKMESTSTIGDMTPTDFHKIVQVKSMYLDTTKLNKLGFFPKKDVYSIIDALI